MYFSGVTGMEKSRTSLDASAVAVPGVIGVRTDCVQSQPGNKFILAKKLYRKTLSMNILCHKVLFTLYKTEAY